MRFWKRKRKPSEKVEEFKPKVEVFRVNKPMSKHPVLHPDDVINWQLGRPYQHQYPEKPPALVYNNDLTIQRHVPVDEKLEKFFGNDWTMVVSGFLDCDGDFEIIERIQ